MNVKVAVSSDFLESYARIPKQQQKKVREFMQKFKANPTSKSINYEKLKNMKDDRVRTVRIGLQYRAVVLHPSEGNVYILLWVDNHDEAMDWAKKRTFEVNPNTGSLQIFNVAEIKKAVPSKKRTKQASLLQQHSDDVLLSFGIPEILLPAVRAITKVTDLTKLTKHLPAESAEALMWLAEGLPVEEIRDAVAVQDQTVDTSDLATALEHPDSQRRFVTLQSDAELNSILEAPLEKWRIFLHPSQVKLVQKNFNGSSRVLGGPGTGKTVVAMHRAKHLAQALDRNSNKKILFTTYTANLAQSVNDNLKNLCGEEFSKIECIHLHSWAVGVLKKQIGKSWNVADSKTLDQIWEKAIFSSEEFDFEPGFLKQEWEQVVQQNEITQKSEYLKISRKGRGKLLSRPQRAKLWKIFMRYKEELEHRNLTEWNTVIRETRKATEQRKIKLPYASVIVDEAQDFNLDEWKLIRAMVPEDKNDLFLVGDSHQRIYGTPVVLSQAGINIRGRSSRLKMNYRTTEQIRSWAMKMLEGLEFDDLDGGVQNEKGYRSLLSGPTPQIYHFSTSEEEVAFLSERLNEFLEIYSSSEICIVARTNKLLKDVYRPMLNELSIKFTLLDKKNSHSGLALATMHRVKGLEFPVMILAGINDEVVPLKVQGISSDQVAQREHLSKERALLFVAATRARDVLVLTSSGNPSRFLQDIKDQ